MSTRGWRVWQLRPNGMLTGMFNQEWPLNGIMDAECISGQCKSWRVKAGTYDDPIPHDKPDTPKDDLMGLYPFHPCGIYTLRTVEIAFDKAKGNTGLLTAIGEIDCYGRILPYEQGYRVAQGVIRNVAVLTQDWYLTIDDEEYAAHQYWTPFGPIWGVTGQPNQTAYGANAMQVRWRFLPRETHATAKKYGCDVISPEVLERVEGHEIHTTEAVQHRDR